jgi:hypothetical protein
MLNLEKQKIKRRKIEIDHYVNICNLLHSYYYHIFHHFTLLLFIFNIFLM